MRERAPPVMFAALYDSFDITRSRIQYVYDVAFRTHTFIQSI